MIDKQESKPGVSFVQMQFPDLITQVVLAKIV